MSHKVSTITNGTVNLKGETESAGMINGHQDRLSLNSVSAEFNYEDLGLLINL